MEESKKTAEKKTAQKFTVIATGGVTIDRYYGRGSTVELTDEKQIKSLTKNKLIK